MNPSFTSQYKAEINSDILASRLRESFDSYGSTDAFIKNMQNHFQLSYSTTYGLNLIANSVVEVSNNYGNNIQDGPFLNSATIALSGIEVFVGMSGDQKAAISRLQLQNSIKPDFENQLEVDDYASSIMDMGYDGFYGLSPSMRQLYDYYEEIHLGTAPDSHIEKSRAGFGFPYSIIERVIKIEELEDFKMQIESDIDWDAEFSNFSADNE